ncbi:hypothetical protein ABN763_00945 [Spongiivirga sp. MCCC 1A20706]|uniref:hypothetical protein n=1 Tax=Spongiivirga sp. MCCC 1A20706 TaxID=3160963 RepID=UPI003977840A
MKALSLFAMAFFLFISCNQKKEVETPLPEVDVNNENALTMEGTWELVNYYDYDGTDITDTVPMAEGYRQVKIYSGDKVMWSRKVPMDSIEYYGYGTYSASEDELIETLDYGSASMLRIIDTMRVFSFELQLKPDTFTQITIDDEGNRITSENYIRIN